MPHQKVEEPLKAEEAGWTKDTMRTALIGLKCGMLPEWDAWGRRIALTVIKVSSRGGAGGAFPSRTWCSFLCMQADDTPRAFCPLPLLEASRYLLLLIPSTHLV